MPDPTVVCAVMLTRDRPEYARRAVECFRAQTYERKRLFILDTGDESAGYFGDYDDIRHEWADLSLQSWPIGKLRNTAIERAGEADIIMHLDDDDWSHPARMAEQVAVLQGSSADCVGYREMLFWREADRFASNYFHAPRAYLYTNTDPTFCLGTSMCYWRKTWERQPFSERNGPNPRERGEDREFLRGIKSVGVPSLRGISMRRTLVDETRSGQFGGPADDHKRYLPGIMEPQADGPCEPRMIARIHSGNARHYTEDLLRNSTSWRRAPEWDANCRSIMEEA